MNLMTNCPRCEITLQSAVRKRQVISEEVAYDGNDPIVIPNTLECIACNIKVIDAMVVLRNLTEEDTRLIWKLNTKECFYFDYKKDMEPLLLPWLPYKISADELRTLLIFS